MYSGSLQYTVIVYFLNYALDGNEQTTPKYIDYQTMR